MRSMCLAQEPGADPGEVKRVNFHPPFSEPPSFFLFFLIPQILIGSNTLLQKFTPHFKILDPHLGTQHNVPGLGPGACFPWLSFFPTYFLV